MKTRRLLLGVLPLGALLVCVACVRGLDEDENMDLVLLESLYATRNAPGSSPDGGTPTPESVTVFIEDRNDGTVNVYWQNLVWAKCSQVDTAGGNMYNDASDDCSAGTAGTFYYCLSTSNACNGGVNTGVLDGDNGSTAWDTCENLTLAGRSDWRLPTHPELVAFYYRIYIDHGSLFDPVPTQSFYWSSSSLNASSARGLDANRSQASGYPKTSLYSVRCVADMP